MSASALAQGRPLAWSSADAVLINAVGFVLVAAPASGEDRAAMMAAIERALPAATRDNPLMAALADHALSLVRLRGEDRARPGWGSDWAGAAMAAGGALAEIFRHRAAAALARTEEG